MTEERPQIDWDRVRGIASHLKKWMNENNYELVDVERACAYMRSPYNLPRSGGTKE